jgi:hypothetical protein
MGWDVIGGVSRAASWVSDKVDGAIDETGKTVDGAVHTAEHAIDDARRSIVDFGDQHGGIVGKALAEDVSNSIGVVEGAALAVYDAAAGVATVARGVGQLTSPLEWALHPERNLARAETAGNALTAMAKLGSPIEWALHPQENAGTAKALWNGVTAGYQDAAKSGDWSKFAGRAVVDVGSFFIGAGEVNAGIKGAEGANAAVHAAEGLRAAGYAGEVLGDTTRAAHGLEGIEDASKAAVALAHDGADAAQALRFQREAGEFSSATEAASDTAARFRGEPFAFGNGTRSLRAEAMVAEGALASRIPDASKLVDVIRYEANSSSYFTVEAGQRVLTIGSAAFEKTHAGQLMEAAHELAHAQVFDRLVGKLGRAAAEADYFSAKYAFGTPLYAREEQLVERLARMRVRDYLGGLTPQQEAASTRYINSWKTP